MNPTDHSVKVSHVDTSPLLVSTGEEENEEDGISTRIRNDITFVESLRLVPDVTGIHPDDEDNAEAQVPTTTQCLQSIKTMYSMYHVPIKILVANVISWILTQSLIRNSLDVGRAIRYNNGSFGSDAFYSQFKSMVATGLAISILTHLTNSYLFFRGARRLDQYMVEKEGSEGDVGTTAIVSGDDNEDDRKQAELRAYSRLSRRVDSTLGMARGSGTATVNQTFLVCFLYGLFSLAVWKSALDSTSLIQIQVLTTEDVPVKGKCCVGGASFDDFLDDFGLDEQDDRGISSLQKEPEFETSVPKDVQDWIRSHRGRWSGTRSTVPAFNRSLPYFHTASGDLVFLKPVPPRSFGSYDREFEHEKAGVVVYTPQTKRTQTFVANTTSSKDSSLWGDDDTEVDLVTFPSKQPYTGWCALFRSHGNSILQDEVLCYNSNYNSKFLDSENGFPIFYGETSHSVREKMKRFDAVRDPEGEWGGYSFGPDHYSMYATDDTLWIANIQEYSYRGSENEHIVIFLLSFDITEMEKTVVLTHKVEFSRSSRHLRIRAARRAGDPDCGGYSTAILVVSVVTLSLLTGFLYRLDVASSSVPACFSVWVILSSILKFQDTTASILLACGCACLLLLVYVPRSNRKYNIWRYVSSEMAVWALYTFQFLSYWVFWSSWVASTRYFFDLEDILSSFPFPLCSFLIAAATTVLLNHPFFQVLSVIFAGFSVVSLFLGVHGSHMFILSGILFAVSFGCFRMGVIMQVYRVHVIVFVRRVGRAWLGKCFNCRQTFSEPQNWLVLVLLVGIVLYIYNGLYSMEEEI